MGSFYSEFSYIDSAGKTARRANHPVRHRPPSAANTAEALQFVQYAVQNAKGLSSFGLQPFTVAMLYNNVPLLLPSKPWSRRGLMAEAGLCRRGLTELA